MANLASIEQVSGDLGDVLRRMAEKNIGKESTILKVITFKLLEQTVKNTRWDTGALKNNWQVSRNLRNKNSVIKKTYDKSGRAAISKGKREASKIRTKDTVYIQNNLSYAAQYEKKDKMLYNAIKLITKDMSK